MSEERLTDRRRAQRAPGGVAAELASVESPIVRPWSPPDDEDVADNAPIPFRPAQLPDVEDEGLPRLRIEGDLNSAHGVRVYHQLITADRLDARWCWAFTISRESAESLISDGPLLADGAAYPDGTPCVPPGTSPYDVEVLCGSCRARGLDHVALRLVAR